MKDFIKQFRESLYEKTLSDIIREGTEMLLKTAIITEFECFFEKHCHLQDSEGKQLIVRNGWHKERRVITPGGIIKVRIPRINDRRLISKKQRLKFHSSLIPPLLKKIIGA